MTTEIRVPQLPESVADATLVAWHKQPGDAIKRDENLADLETDKVVLEVPAPANGVVRELKIQSGTVVTSGQLLAIIEEGTAAAKSAAMPSQSQPAATQANGQAHSEAAGKLSPSVRRLVEENKLDPGAIPASGKDGRLTKSDVVGFLGKQPAPVTNRPEPPVAAAAPAARAPASTPTPTPPARPATGRTEQRVPMTRLRQRIAQRLIEAQSTQALLTSFNEVDMSAVQELRARYKDRFEKDHGVKLGFMSFFVRAVVHALQEVPALNATIDGDTLVENHFYDIGVAVSTDKGLMVPVIRNCDQLGMAGIEKAIGDAAKKA
ncbi:MAG: 2-oxo acid dehydrogenase subunit E2, partial [Steroidobacteraceae bacterium]